jgi:hypothetical protein
MIRDADKLQLVTLSLRGTRFDVPTDYADQLPRSSFLRRVLRGEALVPLDAVGARFIPRNPTHFHLVLDAAVDPSYTPCLEKEWQRVALARELAFWGVGGGHPEQGGWTGATGPRPDCHEQSARSQPRAE